MTDLCRLAICGLGGVFLCVAITGYLDEERGWSLAGTIACALFGLTLVATGIFAKPKTVESI